MTRSVPSRKASVQRPLFSTRCSLALVRRTLVALGPLLLLSSPLHAAPAASAPPASPSPDPPGPRWALGSDGLDLPAGYSRLAIEVPPGQLVSLVVLGDRDALAHFALDAAADPLEEDGRLPRVASFLAPSTPSDVTLSIELWSPARLVRVAAPLPDTLPATPPTLLGMPSPARRDEGYLLERPNRYQFARPDVLGALLDAFRATRRRFRRDPIGVVDISQWDGLRPATDLGKPHHISHEGGRDVDLALPSLEEPSTRRDHCDKLVSRDLSTGLCRRGSARQVDYPRLAFLLGRLVLSGRVDRIFLDTEFIAPTAEAARRLVHPPSFPAWVADRMQPPGGILRHVAWHTDHVHVRFLGPAGTGL